MSGCTHRFTQKLKTALLASAFCISLSPAALADQVTAREFAGYATGGGITKGIDELQAKANEDAQNGEALFGLGALQFLHAIEGLQQDLYQYGAGNGQTGSRGLSSFLPVLRVPVPVNPHAETATYQKVRAIFGKFVTRLQAADQTLAKVGDTPAKLPLKISDIAVDINNDGSIGKDETIAPILAMFAGRGGSQGTVAPDLEIAFDTADASWLRGYTNVLMSIGNFFLSFDFEKSYDVSFQTIFGLQSNAFGHQFENVKGDPAEIAELKQQIAQIQREIDDLFPKDQQNRLNQLRESQRKINRQLRENKALTEDGNREVAKDKLAEIQEIQKEIRPLQSLQQKTGKLSNSKRQLEQRLAALDPDKAALQTMWENIFDPISFLHTIDWPVVEPDRLKAVRHNLLTVMQLNSATWNLVQAETDNDREWLPNPQQTGPFPGLNVTQETIDGWLKTVASAQDVLEGKLLVPHLRFGRGVNMKRFFEEATHFDLVLFLTGPNSIQYVEKGPVWDRRLMTALRDPFGRNFGAYALWFN